MFLGENNGFDEVGGIFSILNISKRSAERLDFSGSKFAKTITETGSNSLFIPWYLPDITKPKCFSFNRVTSKHTPKKLDLNIPAISRDDVTPSNNSKL